MLIIDGFSKKTVIVVADEAAIKVEAAGDEGEAVGDLGAALGEAEEAVGWGEIGNAL